MDAMFFLVTMEFNITTPFSRPMSLQQELFPQFFHLFDKAI